MGRGFDDERADGDLLYLLGLRERMKRLFDEPAQTPSGEVQASSVGWTPPVDICDEGEAFLLIAEVPGVEEADIDLKIVGDSLVLRGERNPDPDEKVLCYHCVERHEGIFQRTFRLPAEVDPDRVRAVCRDGILRVELPKVAPAEEGRAVNVVVEDS